MKDPLLTIKNFTKEYTTRNKRFKAVDNVSFDIYPGETLGLVGESGCGKSTLGKAVVRLHPATSGEIRFKGHPIATCSEHQLQLIFQDPYASLNPRMTAGEIVAEPLKIHGSPNPYIRVLNLLDLVGLDPEHAYRFPHELSGGQRQRIGIARALALHPSLLVCDEPIAALDVSIQAQIVGLLKSLQKKLGLTYLFISHDLAMVKYLSTRIAVMYLGNLVEITTSDELYKNPLHPYTKGLLSAIPIANPALEKARTDKIVIKGEVPSPYDAPSGCPFHTRCPFANATCKKVKPPLREVTEGHKVACHLVAKEL